MLRSYLGIVLDGARVSLKRRLREVAVVPAIKHTRRLNNNGDICVVEQGRILHSGYVHRYTHPDKSVRSSFFPLLPLASLSHGDSIDRRRCQSLIHPHPEPQEPVPEC